MKALSVSQPWASVICSGAKDVENRAWQTAQVPGRILIHATKTKVPGNWEGQPSDHVSTVKNLRLMGQLPEYKDMPYGAIIGYVDCYDIVRDSESFWAEPDSFHWCLRDAYLFDEPIEGITGVRGRLFDVDIDENNLPPAKKITITDAERKGTNIIMPASEAVMKAIEEGAPEMAYDLTATNEWLFFDEDGKEIATKTIEFVCNGKTIKKKVQAIDIGNYLGPNDEPVVYLSFDGQEVAWSYVVFVFE